MADLYAVANSKIFIGGEVTAKDTVTAADFTSQTWVEITGWTAAGAIGDTQEVIEQTVISSGRVRKAKGTRNAGTMENTFLPDGTDPGQIAFKAAIASCKPFAFKIEWGAGCLGPEDDLPAGQTDMFFGLALPGAKAGGEANTAQLRSWAIAVDSNILEV